MIFLFLIPRTICLLLNSGADIERLKIIICMKKTGFTLEELKSYLDIAETSNMHEHPELIAGMIQHKENLKNQMAQFQTVLDFIDQKLSEGSWLERKA
ncbi:MerR family DNA-binding protein [Terribacillus saccharophilus]|uniref:MerR family DNA-binding protein n=1 Tax=Terribacillus saccharophilus TaxID=361277 RepID=UPI00211BC069|nr:MerR family DNA-binding protein [Terribacillus saccharophilus]